METFNRSFEILLPPKGDNGADEVEFPAKEWEQKDGE